MDRRTALMELALVTGWSVDMIETGLIEVEERQRRKDKPAAEVLARFQSFNLIPENHSPTPRQYGIKKMNRNKKRKH